MADTRRFVLGTKIDKKKEYDAIPNVKNNKKNDSDK
jgi:hypothetical protein